MKDFNMASSENMANDPPPFKLERELTLMPSEFRERLSASASHLKSKKSAGHRANRRSANSHTKQQRHHASDETFKRTTTTVTNGSMQYNEYPQDGPSHVNQDELKSVTAHIGFTEHNSTQTVSPELDYSIPERVYNVHTPVDLQIRDLMAPLDDWGEGQEVIRERKYAVLPSIAKKTANPARISSSKTSSTLISQSNDLGFLNQLDYGREKMEEEADFFADYRINTSFVKATPRQNPLPPIKHGEDAQRADDSVGTSVYMNRHHSGRSKQREKFLLLQQ